MAADIVVGWASYGHRDLTAVALLEVDRVKIHEGSQFLYIWCSYEVQSLEVN